MADWPPFTEPPDPSRNVFPSSRSLARMSGYSPSHMAKLARGDFGTGRGHVDFPFRSGRDGKTYPSRRLPPSELRYLVLLVHSMKHDDMTVRGIRHRLGELGIQRSIGAISGYLADWPCRCNVQGCTPEQADALDG